jgi:hypothetical protein
MAVGKEGVERKTGKLRKKYRDTKIFQETQRMKELTPFMTIFEAKKIPGYRNRDRNRRFSFYFSA